MRHTESQLQRACLKLFQYQHPGLARLMFNVPNGAKRSASQSRIVLSEGLVAGVSDLIFLKPNHEFSALCIEFKTEKGKQTDLQKSWQELAEQYGNKYVICRSLDEFMSEVDKYLNPQHYKMDVNIDGE